MKDFVCKINKCTSQLSWRLTKCKNEAGFLIQPQIILPNLFETIGEGILKQSVFLTSRLCLPSRLKLFECRKSTPKCWLFFGGEMLLNPILNPNIWSLNANFWNNRNWKTRTLSISHVSTTLVQSLSVILKADQGMCFTRWLSCHNVVIRP